MKHQARAGIDITCEAVISVPPSVEKENGAPLSSSDIQYLSNGPNGYQRRADGTLWAVGSYTIRPATALHLADLDNDGVKERLVRVEYLNLGGPGCYGEHLVLLPQTGGAAVDTEMSNWLHTRHQAVGGRSNCSVQANIRLVNGLTLLDFYHSPNTYVGPFRSMTASDENGSILTCLSTFLRTTTVKPIWKPTEEN